jgi:light-regulated signal transduction histidine kinase (bacteriophytochrome)
VIRRKNRELTEQKEDLHKLNTVKDQFFSVLSHDLRMPFNNVQSFIHLMSYDKFAVGEQYHDVLKQLEKSTGSAIDMMDNLLTWGKLIMQHTDPKMQEIRLREVFEKLNSQYLPIAEQYKTRISFSAPRDASIFADQYQLEVVLRNLISNAIKHSGNKHDPCVRVQAARVADKTVISVNENSYADNIDIIRETISYNNNSKPKKNMQSNGLGLVLIKQFVRLNKGSISVDTSEANGTTFVLQFPS